VRKEILAFIAFSNSFLGWLNSCVPLFGMLEATERYERSFSARDNSFMPVASIARETSLIGDRFLIAATRFVEGKTMSSYASGTMQDGSPAPTIGGRVIYRHTLLVRITHWINAICFLLLLMSGLQIFNAYPALNWGARSDFDKPILALGAKQESDGSLRGVTTIFGMSFTTTGVLGASKDDSGQPAERGFPSWITIPSYQDLATGRRWHFFFAWLLVLNGAVYVANLFARRHLKDFLPSGRELRSIPASIWQHARLRFPKGDEALHYNVLQKLAYLSVIVALPILVLAGLTMSPAIDATFPWLLTLFGGRQSARTIHFIAAFSLVGFVFVHIVMVLISGFLNNMVSMITGRYAIEEDRHET
jgi:thiosulfate reductase cytochrome b subunit